MKFVRPLLLTLAALVVVLTLAFAVVLTPTFQEWAVRRAVAEQAEFKLEFTRFSAGPKRAEIAGVVFAQAGLRVEVGRLSVDYSLWQLPVRGRLEVSRLTMSEVVLDVSQRSGVETGAGVTTAPAVAPGVLLQARLPWQLVIGDVQVSGRALLPGPAGKPALLAEFEIAGGKLAPGQEGGFLFKTAVTDSRPGAAVTALHANGELRLRQTLDRAFDWVGLTLTVDAHGSRFAEQNQLRLAASMSQQDRLGRYDLVVDTIKAGLTTNLVTINASSSPDGEKFTGSWGLGARDEQVGPFFLGGTLPKFVAHGGGTFTVQPTPRVIDLKGQFEVEASALEAWYPALRPLGLVRLSAGFDLTDVNGLSSINALKVKLAGAQPVLSLETLRPVTFNRSAQMVQFGGEGAGEVARLVLHGLPLAWVRPFVSAVDVSGNWVTGEFVAVGEPEQLLVRSVAPLRVSGLNVVSAGAFLLERADLSVRGAAVLSPDTRRLELTEFELRTAAGDVVRGDLTVEMTSDAATPSVHVLGSVEADLPRLLAPFAPLGHVRLKAAADLTLSPAQIEFRALRGEMGGGDDRRWVGAISSVPFAVSLATMQIVPNGVEERELGRFAYGPLALTDLPLLQARFPLIGQLAAGGFTVTAKGARLLVRPSGAVNLTGLTWSEQGRPMIDRLRLETWPTIEYGGPADWKISDGATTVRNAAGREVATLNAEVFSATADGVRATVNFNLDLAAASAQPALAGLGVLSAGRASGEARAALSGGTVQTEVRATLNGLVAREGNQTLPVANLNLRAMLTADRALTSETALLLDRLGQRSELLLTANAARRNNDVQFTARLTSAHFELVDALALIALTATPPASAPNTPANRDAMLAADARPFWAGVRGDVALEIKSLTRGKDWSMSGLTGNLTVEPERVALTRLDAVVNEKGKLGTRAELSFRTGQQPYQLSGDLSLTEFDVGALLKAFEPDRPPTVEGIFAVTGTFVGNGSTLEHTLERTRGQFQLSSRQGVFRGLRRTSDKISTATRAVELGAALGSLFGTNKVRETAEKLAGQAYQVDQLAQALGELSFDQLLIRVNRDESLNFKVEELSLLSPEVRLSAQGALTHVAGKSLLDLPLTLTYQLGARGKVESTLARLRALDGTKDELGYARMKDTATIRGTLGRPNPSALFVKLAESRLADFLTPGN